MRLYVNGAVSKELWAMSMYVYKIYIGNLELLLRELFVQY